MIAAIAALLLAGTPATTPVRHATGTFAVETTPEAQDAAPAGGLPTGRLRLLKQFTGGLAGTARGTMLTAAAPGGGPATYVAIDQFAGTLDGRAGGFLLAHRGTMTQAGVGDLDIRVSPDTGTGALAGIAGTLSITVRDGVHRYDFAYTLLKGTP